MSYAWESDTCPGCGTNLQTVPYHQRHRARYCNPTCEQTYHNRYNTRPTPHERLKARRQQRRHTDTP